MNIAELETLLAAEGFDPGVYSLDGRRPEYEGLILRKTDASWTIEHFERGVCRLLESLASEDEACQRMHELLSRHCPPEAVKHERSRPAGAGLLADREDSLPR